MDVYIYILVGGFNHLEKYEFVNGKDYPIMEKNKCSKPRISIYTEMGYNVTICRFTHLCVIFHPSLG
jgi:hypothetical protein